MQLQKYHETLESLESYVKMQIGELKEYIRASAIDLNEIYGIEDVKVDFIYNAIIETPRNCKYKITYEKGTYWVNRPLANYREIPCAYGYIENTLADSNHEIDAIIYFPPALPTEFINNSSIGFKCIPIMSFWGKDNFNYEPKVILVPIIYVATMYESGNEYELTEKILQMMYSLHTNYRIYGEKSFKPIEIRGFMNTVAMLQKYAYK
jgi:inorganic pyrophosphatase